MAKLDIFFIQFFPQCLSPKKLDSQEIFPEDRKALIWQA